LKTGTTGRGPLTDLWHAVSAALVPPASARCAFGFEAQLHVAPPFQALLSPPLKERPYIQRNTLGSYKTDTSVQGVRKRRRRRRQRELPPAASLANNILYKWLFYNILIDSDRGNSKSILDILQSPETSPLFLDTLDRFSSQESAFGCAYRPIRM